MNVKLSVVNDKGTLSWWIPLPDFDFIPRFSIFCQDVDGCSSYVDNLYDVDSSKCLDAVV